MALKDRLTNSFLDKAHKRWRIDIDADVSDIVIDMKEAEMQLVEKEKQNILLTWMMSLYSYDAVRLQRDITKMITLKPFEEPSAEESKKLLRVLWNSTQMMFPDMDYTKIFNEIEKFSLFNRQYPDDGSSPFKY